jgi:muramoyltetrapeptide carboxypeptidase
MAYRRLQPGATVALIAPAGPSEPARLDAAVALLEAQSLRVRTWPSCRMSRGYLAGPDAQRLADLHAAFADADVQAVFCLRGGYGCGRLLDRVDTGLLRANPKPLVGYSDITALHALLQREGLMSMHAPMPASDLVRPGREDDARALFGLLRDGLAAGTTLRAPECEGRWRVAGVTEGVLAGGNLAVLASLIGTPYAAPVAGAVLFVEDINEEPYRVDRLFNQLRLAGVLDAAAAFLVGSFTEQESPQAVIEEALAPLRKPVLCGWPAGHGMPNRPLPLGARVRLDSAAATLTLLDDVIV